MCRLFTPREPDPQPAEGAPTRPVAPAPDARRLLAGRRLLDEPPLLQAARGVEHRAPRQPEELGGALLVLEERLSVAREPEDARVHEKLRALEAEVRAHEVVDRHEAPVFEPRLASTDGSDVAPVHVRLLDAVVLGGRGEHVLDVLSCEAQGLADLDAG